MTSLESQIVRAYSEGLTQNEIARQFYVSQSTVSRILAKYRKNIQTFSDFCQLLLPF